MAAIDACVFDLGNVLASFSHERMWWSAPRKLVQVV